MMLMDDDFELAPYGAQKILRICATPSVGGFYVSPVFSMHIFLS